VFIVEQRYIKYLTFSFLTCYLLPAVLWCLHYANPVVLMMLLMMMMCLAALA